MTDEEYQIRRKYENRNLMQELEWVSHYPPSGMSNQDRDFIKWLAMTAYDKINELEQTSVPVHDMELILDEVAKPRWIPVTERLPFAESGDTSETVMVTDGRSIALAEWFNFEESGTYWSYTGIGDITHWMPLPEPPKEE